MNRSFITLLFALALIIPTSSQFSGCSGKEILAAECIEMMSGSVALENASLSDHTFVSFSTTNIHVTTDVNFLPLTWWNVNCDASVNTTVDLSAELIGDTEGRVTALIIHSEELDTLNLAEESSDEEHRIRYAGNTFSQTFNITSGVHKLIFYAPTSDLKLSSFKISGPCHFEEYVGVLDTEWEDCSKEDENCDCEGYVRFGRYVTWSDRVHTEDGIDCIAENFGIDRNDTSIVPKCQCYPFKKKDYTGMVWQYLTEDGDCADEIRDKAYLACSNRTIFQNCSEALTTHPLRDEFAQIPGLKCQVPKSDYTSQASSQVDQAMYSEQTCKLTSDAGKKNRQFVLYFSIAMFVLILFYALPKKFTFWADLRCCQSKSNRVKMRFLNGDPDVTGNYCTSLFVRFFSENIYFAPFFVNKNHYITRLDAAVTLFFCMSWSFVMLLLIQKTSDLDASKRFAWELLGISAPIIFVFQPMFTFFDKKYSLRVVSEEMKDSKYNKCFEHFNNIKNVIITLIAILLAIVAGAELESSANPECFFKEFIRSTVVIATLLGFVNLLFFHTISWWAVITGCKPCYCFLKTICMLPTHQTEEEELELAATPGHTLDKEHERAEDKIELVEGGDWQAHLRKVRKSPDPILPKVDLQTAKQTSPRN